MSEFHRFCKDTEGMRERWMYFDYKHIPEFFKDKKHVFEVSKVSFRRVVTEAHSSNGDKSVCGVHSTVGIVVGVRLPGA